MQNNNILLWYTNQIVSFCKGVDNAIDPTSLMEHHSILCRVRLLGNSRLDIYAKENCDLRQEVKIAAVGTNCCNSINSINFHGSAPSLEQFGTGSTLDNCALHTEY